MSNLYDIMILYLIFTFYQGWALHSFPFGTLRSKQELSVLFRSFLEFLATDETQKNVPFFSKERKRLQRMQSSFAKNGKECKERSFFNIYI